MKLSLKSLYPFNPFKRTVWELLETPVTREEVTQAISEGRFRAEPVETWSYHKPPATRQEHIERVAFLATHEQKEPIEIDVGVPSLGCSVSWIIEDGNHRLAAAFYNGDSHIKANVSGDLDYAKHLFEWNEQQLEIISQ